MTAVVIRGDAAHLPLPDESVDLIVTSPPYFALRSYVDAGQHYEGQIGSESTPQEWLAALLTCTRDWVRTLKPSGSIFVNLGDKYDSGTTTARINPGTVKDGQGQGWHQGTPRVSLGQPKSLLGLPWRYALACMDQTLPHVRADFLDSLLADVLDGTIPHDTARQRLAEFDASPKSKGLGLILRRDIIWSKPNGLPESVTDRCRSSHEYLFHLVKQPRYYAAVDEIREPQAMGKNSHTWGNIGSQGGTAGEGRRTVQVRGWGQSGPREYNPLGKLPGSVWDIPSQPLTVPDWLGVDHFAAFPMELPRRCILGWSPPGICTACGEGRRPVVDRSYEERARHSMAPGNKTVRRLEAGNGNAGSVNGSFMGAVRVSVTGYACACPEPTAPTRPALVVDPFGGTGTTALVADMYGRTGLSFDLSADYCRLARWRTRDPAERAKALQVPKPPPVPDGQGDLFEAIL